MVASFQYIPQAMLQSIGLMAFLFFCFEVIHFLFKTNSRKNYLLAIACYFISVFHFLLQLFKASSILITSIQIPINGNQPIQWISYIGFLYIVAVCIYLLYFCFRWAKLIQLKKHTINEVDSELAIWVKAQMAEAGYHQKVWVGYSKNIEGPITFGWFEPVILLPFSIFNHLSTEEIKCILLHEIAHILRYDYIILLLTELAQIILCFNPFAYYFRHIIQLNREKACDDWVVAKTKNPLLYSKALYQLAKYNYSNNQGLSLAASSNHSVLMDRIQQINGIKSTPVMTRFILSKWMIGIGFATFVLFNFKSSNNPSVNKIQEQVVYNISSNQKSKLILESKPIARKIVQKNKIIEPLVEHELIPLTTDSAYQVLIQSTIDWIKARTGNNNSEPILTNYDEVNDFNKVTETSDYSVAEQLLLKAVIHKYELKRAIIANQLSKANSKEEAINIVKNSKEWIELQQYEQWAKSFLKQHPLPIDSTAQLIDF